MAIPSYDKVITLAHSSCGFDDLALVIFDNLDSFEILCFGVSLPNPQPARVYRVHLSHTIPREKHHFAR